MPLSRRWRFNKLPSADYGTWRKAATGCLTSAGDILHHFKTQVGKFYVQLLSRLTANFDYLLDVWLKSVSSVHVRTLFFDQVSFQTGFFSTLLQHLIKLVWYLVSEIQCFILCLQYYGTQVKQLVIHSISQWQFWSAIVLIIQKYSLVFSFLNMNFWCFSFHDSKVNISGFWTQTISSRDVFALFSDILQIKLLIKETFFF